MEVDVSRWHVAGGLSRIEELVVPPQVCGRRGRGAGGSQRLLVAELPDVLFDKRDPTSAAAGTLVRDQERIPGKVR